MSDNGNPPKATDAINFLGDWRNIWFSDING